MSKEAMKLALEALKQIDEAMPFPVAKLAQAALREALNAPLAQQPAQHKPLSEPEERKAFEMYWQAKHDNRRYCESAFEGWKARAAPQPEQQALDKKAENARELGLDYEPAQQEPVAWLSEGGNFSFEPWQRSIPLYTSPPAQRKPLD